MSGTSTDDFSVKEATFNLKLAECMQKTCGNLNPWLHKNRSYELICDFYWRLSHYYIDSTVKRHIFLVTIATVHIQLLYHGWRIYFSVVTMEVVLYIYFCNTKHDWFFQKIGSITHPCIIKSKFSHIKIRIYYCNFPIKVVLV